MNVGRDLIGVQNLMKKHQAVLAEINNHEPRIAAVAQSGQNMIEQEHFASEEITLRTTNLSDHWNQLKDKALQVIPSYLIKFRGKIFHYSIGVIIFRLSSLKIYPNFF